MPIVLPRNRDIASSRSRPTRCRAAWPNPGRRRIRKQTHHRHRGRRLARTGFADDRDDLAGIDVKVDAAHRFQCRTIGGEVDAQAGDVEEPAHRRPPRAAPLAGSSASRNPSPVRFAHTRISTRTPAGNRKTHGNVVAGLGAVGDQRSQRHVGRLDAETEEAQTGFGQDRQATFSAASMIRIDATFGTT